MNLLRQLSLLDIIERRIPFGKSCFSLSILNENKVNHDDAGRKKEEEEKKTKKILSSLCELPLLPDPPTMSLSPAVKEFIASKVANTDETIRKYYQAMKDLYEKK